ncbi:Two-component sensor histidine kinase, contains HisKA and HATPase domains [Zhouia amylolytica]|uniref:histidine kinase n=1 Tax=Zhouia amylolytica TaxID=376730 RepID=A0A1I6T6K5_9FLAO|nr:histidine kinase dimerization/phosphoacceptor domain -containing protein [Zhouia amylolytica]SFS84881.1 Two-component sensor histidine kinase, contains HisKA and HATPase domains [Zhouia amylolytica]
MRITLLIFLLTVFNSQSQNIKSQDTTVNCQRFLTIAEKQQRESKLSKAIENYIKVKECVGNKKYSPLFVQSCIGLGNVYNEIYDTYEAVNQFKEGINHQLLFKKIEPIPQMYLRDGIGRALINEGKYKDAILLTTLSVNMAKLSKDKLFEIETLNNLIYLLSLQGNVKEVEKHIKNLNTLIENTELSKKTSSLIEISKLAYKFAKKSDIKSIYSFKNKYLKSEFSIVRERFLRLLHQIDLKERKSDQILKSYVKWDNLRDSVQHNFYKNFKDSLLVRSQKRVIDDELFRLKTQEQLSQNEIEYKNANITYLTLLFIISITSLFLVYYFFKKIKKQKNMVETLQKELHHRMKNNLSFIDLFINLAKGRFEDEAYQTKLNELQNRMRSMFEVNKQLFKKDDITSVKAKNYIDTLVKNVQEAYAKENISILNKTKNEETILADTSFPVGLIVNEFVTNSYKYAFNDTEKGIIDINLSSNSKSYTLSLKDNGKGLPKDFDIDSLDSFGLETIQLLTQEYGGTFNIDGSSGVAMNITLPKTAA